MRERVVDADSVKRRARQRPNNLEARLVALLVEGLKTKEIAATMSLTVPAVHRHIRKLFEKLGVRDPLELLFHLAENRYQIPSDPAVQEAASPKGAKSLKSVRGVIGRRIPEKSAA